VTVAKTFIELERQLDREAGSSGARGEKKAGEEEPGVRRSGEDSWPGETSGGGLRR
jgi:hypothetical protein